MLLNQFNISIQPCLQCPPASSTPTLPKKELSELDRLCSSMGERPYTAHAFPLKNVSESYLFWLPESAVDNAVGLHVKVICVDMSGVLVSSWETTDMGSCCASCDILLNFILCCIIPNNCKAKSFVKPVQCPIRWTDQSNTLEAAYDAITDNFRCCFWLWLNPASCRTAVGSVLPVF